MNYLTATELAELIGCKQNSYSCMVRWLKSNGWPFVVKISGFPSVSRAYHDAHMSGTVIGESEKKDTEPNFDALMA